MLSMSRVQHSFILVRRLSILVVMSLLLAACQPAVRTDIATFRDEGLSLTPGSIVVVPDSDETAQSLEFRYFKDKLAARFQAAGLSPEESDSTDYVARLGYSVSRQEKDQPNSRVYIGGHIGYHRYPHHGSVLLSDVGDEFEYVRELTIAVERRASEAPLQIVQVKAASVGQCEHLTVVYDEMLDAIFSNLLRADGSVEKVTIKGDTRCP